MIGKHHAAATTIMHFLIRVGDNRASLSAADAWAMYKLKTIGIDIHLIRHLQWIALSCLFDSLYIFSNMSPNCFMCGWSCSPAIKDPNPGPVYIAWSNVH